MLNSFCIKTRRKEMALNVIKQVIRLKQRPLLGKTVQRCYSLYEPDYLETGKSKIPYYALVNVQIKGYVFAILENYQSFIHKTAESMDIDVDDSFGLPGEKLKIERFKPKTTAVDAVYHLQIYERNTQLADVSATTCPMLIRVLEAALPEGVTLKFDIFDPAMTEKRYIPDKALVDLKSQLTSMGQE